MKLEPWIKRHVVEVDQDGEHCSIVKLCAVDGSLYDSWKAKYIADDPDRWISETEALQAELAAQLPRGAVQLTYIAESPRGEIRGQCIVTVQGQNAKGSRSLVDGGQQATANAMGALATTMERILSTANAQLEHLSRTNETQSRHLVECYEFIRRKMETEALEVGQRNPPIPDELQQMVIEHAPKVIELLSFLTQKSPKPSAPNGAADPNPAPAANSNGAN